MERYLEQRKKPLAMVLRMEEMQSQLNTQLQTLQNSFKNNDYFSNFILCFNIVCWFFRCRRFEQESRCTSRTICPYNFILLKGHSIILTVLLYYRVFILMKIPSF